MNGRRLHRACVLMLCVTLPVSAQIGAAQTGGARTSVARTDGLTLAEATRLALRGAEPVRLRELALQKARLAVDEATAKALPRVDLQASASYLVNPPQGYTVKAGDLGIFTPTIPAGPPLGSPVPIPLGAVTIPPNDFTIGAQEHNYFSLSASLSQPLFTWGKIRGAIDLAALQAESAGIDLVAQRADIQREVHRAYFGALLAGGSETVLQRLRDTAAQIASDRRKAFDDGTTNQEAVLQAQADLAEIETKLAEAGQSRMTALESLAMLTGLEAPLGLATDFSAALPALDEQSIRDSALRSSTDLTSSRTRIKQARRKLDVERGGSLLRPDVSLGLSFTLTGQEDLPYAAWSWDSGAWNWDLVISLGMKMSVFDGLASRSRIAQAEKDVDLAGTAATQEEKLVRLAVRKAVDAAVRAEADVKEKQAKSLYAQERLKNAQASFDNGLASRTDLRGAEILEGTAALELLFARYTREEALADISRLTGEAS